MITHVDENGLLSFLRSAAGGGGAGRPAGRARRRARAHVPGVVGRSVEPAPPRRGIPRLELSDLHIDIGASSTRGGARAGARRGRRRRSPASRSSSPNGRIASRSLDNRLGAYVALEAARRVAEAGDAPVDVVAVAAVQEELGYYGARTAAFSLEPRGRARDRRHLRDRRPRRRSEGDGADRARLGRGHQRAGRSLNTGSSTCSRRPPRRRASRTPSRCSTNRTHTDADAAARLARGRADGPRLDAAPLHALAGRARPRSTTSRP